jgi:ribosomal protein S12 methylthiotransferase accessory factor
MAGGGLIMAQPLQAAVENIVVDSVTGIVRSVFTSANGLADPTVYSAATEIAKTQVYHPTLICASNGSGAGLTLEDAYGAAIGESVERYALMLWYPEEVIVGSFNQLLQKGYSPVAPDKWALFDPSQYSQLPFAPFHEHTPIGWVKGDSLTYKWERLVPACMTYMPYHTIQDDECVIAPAISTGAACATTIVEGLLKGICELIERDAFMIIWRNRIPCPRIVIDPRSTLYPLFRERFERPGLDYFLFHTTLDLQIPSVFGILREYRRGKVHFVVAGAAHPDPNIAVLKTLLELVQGLHWLEFVMHQSPSFPASFDKVTSFDDRMYLYAFGDIGNEAFDFLINNQDEVLLSEMASLDKGSHKDNLRMIINILLEKGIEVIGINLTPIDIAQCGLFVTRVFAPGLETMEGDHNQQFLGGRRWREVPVHCGLRDRPLCIEEVNPYPHPYP